MIASTIQTGVEKVWATLGSGHSEIIYQNALRIELSKSKEIHHLSSGRVVPITYEGFSVGSCVLDLDFVTNFDQMVILELKSIRALRSDDHMQILRYTRLFGNVIGFLINFPTGDAKPEIHEFVGEERGYSACGSA